MTEHKFKIGQGDRQPKIKSFRRRWWSARGPRLSTNGVQWRHFAVFAHVSLDAPSSSVEGDSFMTGKKSIDSLATGNRSSRMG